jgi:hypothetical protein
MGSDLSDDATQNHYEWRERVNAHLPKLSARVFALRSKPYRGCGFHYGLERQLGNLIARMNDHDNEITFSIKLRDELGLEFLLRGLLRAEFSAKGLDFPDKHRKIA